MSETVKRLVIVLATALVVVVVFLAVRQKPVEQEYAPVEVPAELLNLNAKEVQLKESLKANPNDVELLYQLGALYFESNRFPQAIEVYRKILAIDAGHIESLIDLGLALQYTGRSEEAVNVLKRATTVEPEHQRVWLSLGFVLAASGRYEEARPALLKAAELNPGTPAAEEAKRILEIVNRRSS